MTDAVWPWVVQGLVTLGTVLWCRSAARRAVRAEMRRWQDELASLLEAACDRLAARSVPQERPAPGPPTPSAPLRDPAAARLRQAVARRQAARR